MALKRSPEFCFKLIYTCRYLSRAGHFPGYTGSGHFDIRAIILTTLVEVQ